MNQAFQSKDLDKINDGILFNSHLRTHERKYCIK
jgi:hypothetical protein